jgi:hypothetical protein
MAVKCGDIGPEAVVSVHWTSVRENGDFDYIDGARRAKVDIGCPSIHVLHERNWLPSIRRVPERDALDIQIP